ncbi:DOMON domain-containing protein, partial [Salmonella sp. s51228]|uniref:DOMON domain-containing protein n=1 Tax=Salmonella sp. s51228 TaxID=3159652 RepID=UPI00397EBB97
MAKLYCNLITCITILIALTLQTNGQTITTGCGTTKTCLAYVGCGVEGAGTTNENIGTFTTSQSTTYFDFQMTTTSAGWIGFGISRDRFMPQSEVYICYVGSGTAKLQSRYTTGRSQPPENTETTFTLTSATFTNGALRCKFTRNNVTVNNFDLNDSNGYYILLAHGTTFFQYHGTGNRCPSVNNYALFSNDNNSTSTATT